MVAHTSSLQLHTTPSVSNYKSLGKHRQTFVTLQYFFVGANYGAAPLFGQSERRLGAQVNSSCDAASVEVRSFFFNSNFEKI